MSRTASVALIVAAGRGVRAGTDVPKQYVMLGNRAVLAHTLRPFIAHPAVDHICVVIHADDQEAYAAAVADVGAGGGDIGRLLPPVTGGATRQQSVSAGLEAVAARFTDSSEARVLIHDAARPFVSPAVIDRILAALDVGPAAIAAVPLADTLKRADDEGFVAATLARDGLWRAQTPQGFHLDVIIAAHRAAAAVGRYDFTDDSAVAEWHGVGVRLVRDDAHNSKLTTAEDIEMARVVLSSTVTREVVERTPADNDIRIGQGFDVHRFIGGDHVWLCGVRVPHDQGVDAHSDGDVALHALTDALLGAIADGDIGVHFKNTDARWRGASSDLFLADAMARVAAQGGRISNVDVTVLCEAPKIGPHREAMRARIAAILGLPIDRVGLKATTTERLGFAGRGEGLAAMAIATVIMGQRPS